MIARYMFQPTDEFGAIWRQGYQVWYLATKEYSNTMSARYMFQPSCTLLVEANANERNSRHSLALGLAHEMFDV